MNSHLIGTAYLLNRGGLFLAQATSLDTAIGGGMGILARIAYIGAFAMNIAASWNVQKTSPNRPRGRSSGRSLPPSPRSS